MKNDYMKQQTKPSAIVLEESTAENMQAAINKTIEEGYITSGGLLYQDGSFYQVMVLRKLTK